MGRAADLTERRRLLLTVLDAVYVDAREARTVVGIRSKPAFEVVLTNHPLDVGSLLIPSGSIIVRAIEAETGSCPARDIRL